QTTKRTEAPPVVVEQERRRRQNQDDVLDDVPELRGESHVDDQALDTRVQQHEIEQSTVERRHTDYRPSRYCLLSSLSPASTSRLRPARSLKYLLTTAPRRAGTTDT